ncbi:MAG: fluoride efflux transporter CrcB [Candidatus Gastranaerophilales bacterium]
MLSVFAIFIGGGVGAVLRYLCGVLTPRLFILNFPVSTMFVNFIGSFLIGFLFVLFLEKQELNTALKLALTVGFCGGLTTFSTFSLEAFDMIVNQRYFEAISYILASVIICLLAVVLGVSLCKNLIN